MNAKSIILVGFVIVCGPPIVLGIILGLKYDWVVGLASAVGLLVILVMISQSIIKKRTQAARVDAPGDMETPNREEPTVKSESQNKIEKGEL